MVASSKTLKLPVKQLTILVIARLAEPIALTSVFPYLPEMIRDFGVGQNQVAKWAGITAAIFAISQGLTAVSWGRAADRVGRKPILLCGLFCTMVCFLAWGMSTSLAMAMTVRAIQGFSNGNVAIIRTIVAEIVPEKELQPRAFSLMPLVWSLGSVIGPAFGGALAQPAEKYPSVFGHLDFFKRFPYALPNFVATVFFLTSATTVFLFFQETLPAKRHRRDWGLEAGQRLTRLLSRNPFRHRKGSIEDAQPAPICDEDESSKPPAAPISPPGVKELCKRPIIISLIAYTFLALHSIAYDQSVTVFLNYPVIKSTPENTRLPFYFSGGHGLRSSTIGTLFTIYGIVCAIVQFVFYPSLVKRFGIVNCSRACVIILPIAYALTPFTSLLPTAGTRFVAILCVLIFKGIGSIMSFPCATILLTNSCESIRILGTVNGLATSFSGFARAIGPATTGIIFSWGADHGYIISAYLYLVLLALLGAIPAYMTVEGPGPSASSTIETSANDGCVTDDRLRHPCDAAAYEGDEDVGSDDGSSVHSPLLGNGKQKQPASYNAVNH
ncbi:hypothetical protein CDD81_4446 [Ophiocordyceps australis]|uniref:Major facilitator superfamily (MFS) profile domain-containing protein n=1 Tax=Ophiocordyceps australis TaxID=1399860 RepID=A0A2C5YJG3_9HYPO|nr:hypothetical protein CDD81_4446 [Ophiocordyceps australis]